MMDGEQLERLARAVEAVLSDADTDMVMRAFGVLIGVRLRRCPADEVQTHTQTLMGTVSGMLDGSLMKPPA